MAPCEWALCCDGHAAQQKNRNRLIAQWLSPLISATAGQVITPQQLLGEDDAPDTARKVATQVREAERKLLKMQKAIAKSKAKRR